MAHAELLALPWGVFWAYVAADEKRSPTAALEEYRRTPWLGP
jgi:hypothetical protein